jgi:hypothetical protein
MRAGAALGTDHSGRAASKLAVPGICFAASG